MNTLKDKFEWLVDYICDEKEITRNQLFKRERKIPFVTYRQIIMNILYSDGLQNPESSKYSLQKIGLLFKNNINPGYDHATVLHANKTINNQSINRRYLNEFNQIKSAFTNRFSIFYNIFYDCEKTNKRLIGLSILGR